MQLRFHSVVPLEAPLVALFTPDIYLNWGQRHLNVFFYVPILSIHSFSARLGVAFSFCGLSNLSESLRVKKKTANLLVRDWSSDW